jgi:hypothetical protein
MAAASRVEDVLRGASQVIKLVHLGHVQELSHPDEPRDGSCENTYPQGAKHLTAVLGYLFLN